MRYTWASVVFPRSQSDSKCQNCCFRVWRAARDILCVYTSAAWFSSSLGNQLHPRPIKLSSGILPGDQQMAAVHCSGKQRRRFFVNRICHSHPRTSGTIECEQRRRTEPYLVQSMTIMTTILKVVNRRNLISSLQISLFIFLNLRLLSFWSPKDFSVGHKQVWMSSKCCANTKWRIWTTKEKQKKTGSFFLSFWNLCVAARDCFGSWSTGFSDGSRRRGLEVRWSAGVFVSRPFVSLF